MSSHHSNDGSEDGKSSSKRSATDQSAPRKKRGRYTLNACDECKRRKTKCTGENPCRLCKSIGETCEYSRETGEEVTQKYMNSTIQSLQRQIAELSSIVDNLRNGGISQRGDQASNEEDSPASPIPSQSLGPGLDTSIANIRDSAVGPTSSSYAFNFVDSSLKDSGLSMSAQPSAPASPPLTETDAPACYQDLMNASDPLTAMSLKDIIRFLKLYEEDLGLQIPHLETAKMIACVESHAKLAGSGNVARDSACSTKCYYKEGSDSLLKLTVANMLLLEDHKNRPVALKLMESLEQSESRRFIQDTKIEPDELSLMILKAIYHFLGDNERLAWRMMGFAARMCLEIGLHRRHNLAQRFASISERKRAVKLFWCVYVLERRWSFGSGLPSAINDADVDQVLNEVDIPSLYLRSMISYCKIASHVWTATASAKVGAGFPADHDCSYMEFQVLEWHRALPGVLQLVDPLGGFDSRIHNRGVYRLQVLQYLRANQMRILIHRPYLFSKAGINSNPDKARKAIDFAKDSIRVLKKLHETSNIYSRQHMVFNHFLDSALAVLLLAVCNEPRGTADLVRKEITTALELVHNLATRSPISKRLWNRLKKYREVPRRLSGSGKEKAGTQLQDYREQTQMAPISGGPASAMALSGTTGSDKSGANMQQYSTSTINSSNQAYDPEFWNAYESLFAANAHMLDGLRGNPNEWSSGAIQTAQNPPMDAQLGMTSSSGPGTWALDDPVTYSNINSSIVPTGTVIQPFTPQTDNNMTPNCFDDVSRDLFSF